MVASKEHILPEACVMGATVGTLSPNREWSPDVGFGLAEVRKCSSTGGGTRVR